MFINTECQFDFSKDILNKNLDLKSDTEKKL